MPWASGVSEDAQVEIGRVESAVQMRSAGTPWVNRAGEPEDSATEPVGEPDPRETYIAYNVANQ